MSDTEPALPRSTLAALIEASAAINSTLELEPTLKTIAERAAAVMDAEASSVLLLDRARRKLVFKAATGVSADSLLGMEFDASLGIAGKALNSPEPVLVTDVSKDQAFFADIDHKINFRTRSIAAARLIRKDQVVGVVEVINKRGAENFSARDLELLQIFANLAACGAFNAETHERLRKENRNLIASQSGSPPIIGQSPALRQMLDLCTRVAASNATALLLGETGTGKEVASRFIHASSPRRDKPFVAINCAALPETLLESELFGHEKGAFTGAVGQKLGRFELAHGGTLFLDEIGEIAPATQIKLLRVLQEREFVRVGGTRTVACDVRIVAATNRDLQQCVRAGTFREDLYYRLSVFPIQTPPLRQRREDIPLLVEYFVRNSAAQLNVRVPRISDAAMAALTAYNWPGNIRELQNVVERAVLLCDGDTIEPSALPREIAGDAEATTSPPDRTESSLWGYEKALIVKALKENNWNQTRAARALGISRDNLRYRVKKFRIQKPA